MTTPFLDISISGSTSSDENLEFRAKLEPSSETGEQGRIIINLDSDDFERLTDQDGRVAINLTSEAIAALNEGTVVIDLDNGDLAPGRGGQLVVNLDTDKSYNRRCRKDHVIIINLDDEVIANALENGQVTLNVEAEDIRGGEINVDIDNVVQERRRRADDQGQIIGARPIAGAIDRRVRPFEPVARVNNVCGPSSNKFTATFVPGQFGGRLGSNSIRLNAQLKIIKRACRYSQSGLVEAEIDVTDLFTNGVAPQPDAAAQYGTVIGTPLVNNGSPLTATGYAWLSSRNLLGKYIVHARINISYLSERQATIQLVLFIPITRGLL